jgi:hypothetical protein
MHLIGATAIGLATSGAHPVNVDASAILDSGNGAPRKQFHDR